MSLLRRVDGYDADYLRQVSVPFSSDHGYPGEVEDSLYRRRKIRGPSS